MRIHIVPLQVHIPIYLQSFKLINIEPYSQEPYEAVVLITYKDKLLTIGYIGSAFPEDSNIRFVPTSKIFCRDYTSNIYEPISAEPLEANALNCFSTEELDSKAELILTSLEERAKYLELSSQEALMFLLEKTNKLLSLKSSLSKLVPGSTEYNNLNNYIQYLDQIPKTTLPLKYAIGEIKNLIEVLPLSKEDQLMLYLTIRYSYFLDKPGLPPLLFSGPPGVGKTTFAYDLAKLLETPMRVFSLGDKTDKNYVSGFLRTYTNSSPGIIVQELINTKCLNPILVCDEIDKSSTEVQNSFLSLLDPSQNTNWVDAYINQPIDVSNITFIFTSNDNTKLSKPFRDRLTEVHFRNYSTEELKELIKNKLIPKISKELSISDTITNDLDISNLLTHDSIRTIEKNLKLLLVQKHIAKDEEFVISRKSKATPSRKPGIGF
jgi:ATP-dependent Lon protease